MHSHNQSLYRISEFAARLSDVAQVENHRYVLVLAGEHEWCVQAAHLACSNPPFERQLWISQYAPHGVKSLTAAKAHKMLGQEVDAVVFDAYGGFDPDAFGAVAGLIRGGGLLFLLTPPLAEWPAFVDPEYSKIAVTPYQATDVSGRFIKHIINILRAHEGIFVIGQGGDIPQPPVISQTQASSVKQQQPEHPDEFRTSDQLNAVEAVVKVVSGHRRRPVVLTSDRGRGKSAALGIAAAKLIQTGVKHIILTGPRLDAVESVFYHAHRLLPKASVSRNTLHFGEASMEFTPPDELVLTSPDADLVLVDEAATIPAQILEQLLHRYSRIAFATTVHGYEGTGRGFAIRFHQVLNKKTPDWKAVRLETPIRWALNDPLEKFVFKALLLDASAAPDDEISNASGVDCTVEMLDREELVENKPVISELFGLLVLAHYRTRPNDLRHMLDGPNVKVFALFYNGHVVATALVAEEGGIDEQTATAVYLGKRRLQGHLIPQSLAAHAGVVQAASLTCYRVMRIAVHPVVQGRGLGTKLLASIVNLARENEIDYIGSSFGANVELLRFWERAGFFPVRLGFTREHTSGTHSSIVLYPASEKGAAVFSFARERFMAHFPHLLSDPLWDIDQELAAFLIASPSQPTSPIQLDDNDWRDLRAFAFAKRGYEVTMVAIWKFICAALSDPKTADLLNTQERDILISKVLQKWNWSEVANIAKVSGRSQVIETMRGALRKMLKS